MKTRACQECEGRGYVEVGCGEVERCAPCHGQGVAADRARSTEQTELDLSSPPANDDWSPYPWPFGRHRDYYDREAA